MVGSDEGANPLSSGSELFFFLELRHSTIGPGQGCQSGVVTLRVPMSGEKSRFRMNTNSRHLISESTCPSNVLF